MDKLFLIAIGGTGMRCLEAFVHLCAAGLFDNRTIEILTLDTDHNNGNKDRVETLIKLYNDVKTNDNAKRGGDMRAETFFSAKLNLYRFFTDYSDSDRLSLHALATTNGLTEEQREDNQDLTDLLFDRETVQRFKLDHGYRAQTHLGSMLMYHGIIEAARNVRKGEDVKEQEADLAKFLKLLNDNSNHARVFVFGSIFGGTGASSIPVIPIAFSEALGILTGNNAIDTNKVLFGSTLLTDYFSFKTPTDTQLVTDKVIADSNNFALNSQAALSFYNSDETVRGTYKRMYHIGCPPGLRINYSVGQNSNVVTGGANQRNDAHILELMCAAAAYDFFSASRSDLEAFTEANYVFRSIETDDDGKFIFTGKSFVGPEAAEKFENKLGAFLSFAHIILSKFDGAYDGASGTANFLNYLNEAKFPLYNDITDNQCAEIDAYLKEFGYKFLKDDVKLGWIYQINHSVNGGKFLFSPEAFKTNIRELKKIDPGIIFNDPAHHWDKTGNMFDRTRFNTLVSLLKDPNITTPDENQAATLKEQFLAHIYNAITVAQHYNLQNDFQE